MFNWFIYSLLNFINHVGEALLPKRLCLSYIGDLFLRSLLLFDLLLFSAAIPIPPLFCPSRELITMFLLPGLLVLISLISIKYPCCSLFLEVAIYLFDYALLSFSSYLYCLSNWERIFIDFMSSSNRMSLLLSYSFWRVILRTYWTCSGLSDLFLTVYLTLESSSKWIRMTPDGYAVGDCDLTSSTASYCIDYLSLERLRSSMSLGALGTL